MCRLYGTLLALAMLLAPMAAMAVTPTVRLASVTVAGVSPSVVRAMREVTPSLVGRPAQAELVAAGKAVEDLFNAVTTMRATFTQHTAGEKFSSHGDFYWQKPGKFLWQYETPVRQKIVSTGTAVFYVDQSTGKDGQVTQLPFNAGLGRLFNARTLNLSKEGLRVIALQDTPQQRTLTLVMIDGKKEMDAGGLVRVRVMLRRDKGALVLAGLEGFDKMNNTTRVTFEDVVLGGAIPKKLFEFVPQVGVEH